MNRLIILIAILLAPAEDASAALTMEYYTFGGHDAIVNSFNKIALIFGSNNYAGFLSSIAVIGLVAFLGRVLGNLLFGGFKGDHNFFTLSLVPWLLSTAIFIGTVLPKGTLHIYDPTENKYQAVGGIPDILVFFAGATNLIERGFVDMVSTSGDPVGFQSQAGGKGYLGLYKLSTQPLLSLDNTLNLSLQNYSKDCVTFEIARSKAYASEVLNSTTNLIDTFAKAVNPMIDTVLFDPAGSDAGDVVSCTDAWANLKPRLEQDNSLKNNLIPACTEMGFDIASASGLNDCMSRISGIVGEQVSPGKNTMDFVKSAYLSQSMEKALSTDGAYGNYQIGNRASGLITTMNNWQPYLRAVILAVSIGLTPFLAFLIMTPVMGKAIKYILGSFVFLTVWGVVDAILHQFITDYANKLYSEIRQYSLGIDAIRFFPGPTEKILIIFGIVRASSLAIAASVTSGVLSMSSIAAEVGGKAIGGITGTGAQAEQQTLDPASKAGALKSNQAAMPTMAMANEYAWDARQSVETGRQVGEFKQQQGAISGANGMPSYLDMRQNQGFTSSYRSQGDNKLNQEFMAKAQEMGIPREQAQQIAAATINHGEGLAELRRLQQQGYSGKAAADTYWQGKTVDHMQSRSVGQVDGFTLHRPTVDQEKGQWGQVSATWQNGQLVGLQGNSVSVVDTEAIRTGYDKSFGNTVSEMHKAEQSVGQGIVMSWGNSGTWSQVSAAAEQLYKATSGSVDASKAISTSVLSSIRNSQAVDERTGQSVDKSLWAQITGGAGTLKISPLKAGIEGGASWRVTTSDGKSYVVNQSADEARSTNESLGKTWRNVSSTVRSGNYSSTAQAALAEMESITGTKTANESASVAYQQAADIAQRRSEALSRAAEARTALDRDFYSYIGQSQFGGGESGDRKAIKHMEGLAAEGKTAEINSLREQYYQEREINAGTLGIQMPDVKGPDVSKIPNSETITQKIETDRSELNSELGNQKSYRNIDPSTTVKQSLKMSPAAADESEINSKINDNYTAVSRGKGNLEEKGASFKNKPEVPNNM
jgi:hypothetical protein